MPLINCRVELSLRWIENCVLTTAAIGANANATGTESTIFKITDAKLYVPIVTLSVEDNAKSSKLLGEGFQKSIYWNKYKVIDNVVVSINDANEEKYIREQLDANYQGVKRLFVLSYNTTGNNQVSVDSFKKIFLPRIKIKSTILKLIEETFMISQLITRLSNTKKSEKYQQDKAMITRLVIYWILLIFKKNTDPLLLI